LNLDIGTLILVDIQHFDYHNEHIKKIFNGDLFLHYSELKSLLNHLPNITYSRIITQLNS